MRDDETTEYEFEYNERVRSEFEHNERLKAETDRNIVDALLHELKGKPVIVSFPPGYLRVTHKDGREIGKYKLPTLREVSRSDSGIKLRFESLGNVVFYDIKSRDLEIRNPSDCPQQDWRNLTTEGRNLSGELKKLLRSLDIQYSKSKYWG